MQRPAKPFTPVRFRLQPPFRKKMMNINKVNNEINSDQMVVEYEDDFSLSDLVAIIKDSKNLILSLTLFMSIGSAIYISFIPDTYSSDSLLTIVDDSEAGGSGFKDIASRYGGLASIAGVAINNDSNSKSDQVMATIKSRNFFEHITKDDAIFAPLVAAKKYDKKSEKLIFDSKIYDSTNSKWINGRPSTLGAHAKFFLKKLTLSQDKKTGFIFLSFEHISPDFAYIITQLIIEEANNIIRLQHLDESKRSLGYLNAALANTREIGTKESISTLVEAQLKIQMLADVRKDYMIRPIDKPYLPEWKSNPMRLRFVILMTILGLVIGTFLSMYLHYFSNSKQT